jgi:hypothetical protein
MAQAMWSFTTSFLSRLLDPSGHLTLPNPNWSHAVFANSILAQFQPVASLWLLLKGVTIWCMWIARNHCAFNTTRWRTEHVANLIWTGLSNYAKVVWRNAQHRIRKEPSTSSRVLKKFDHDWGRFPLLCAWQELTVTWCHRNPVTGIG